jgi:hypothetical protein
VPRTIEEGFRDFLTRLTPDDAESAASVRHRESIEKCLRSKFTVERYWRTGSFGNGTSVSRFSDVDYFAVIPVDQLSFDANISLRRVRTPLARRFGDTGVRISAPAIVIPFGSKASERTEVVPAIYVRKQGNYNVYQIASQQGGWMIASPDAHNEYVAHVDGKLKRKVRPLIRFVKAWKYHQSTPLASFYLELRVATWAQSESEIEYGYDMLRFLLSLQSSGLASMQDPMGITGLIHPCKTSLQKTQALSRLKTATTRAQKAIEAAERGKIAEAFRWWRQLFGVRFPPYSR